MLQFCKKVCMEETYKKMSEKTVTSDKQILLQKHPEPPMVCLTGIGNELFQAIQDPILVVTPDGIIIDANNAALNAAEGIAQINKEI